jgi:flagella basal body P-ring formation protein FlgA
MSTFMQILCRVLLSGLAKALALMLLAFAAQANAPEDSTRQGMLEQAKTWMAQLEGKPAAQILFAPMDERVQVKPCASPLQFDLPFASRDTLRVRCPGNAAWQLYLRTIGPAVAKADARGEIRPVASEPFAVKTAPELRKVVVAKQQLQRGTRLTPDMFEVVERAVPNWTPAMLASLQDMSQMELVRDLPEGSYLQVYDTKKSVLVKQGQIVMLTLGEGKGFQISVKVEAMQDGRFGEQIRLKNAESGKILSGVVAGTNAIKGI